MKINQQTFANAQLRLVADVTASSESRIIRVLASAPTLDSHGTTINPNGWKLDRYRANPVVCFGHDTHKLPIARAAEVLVKSDGLEIAIEFPPAGTYDFADTVFRLMKLDFLRGASVGFWPLRWEARDDSDVIDILEQDLFELSVVTIPSNPDTLKKMAEAGFDAEALRRAISGKSELQTGEQPAKAAPVVAIHRARRQLDVNRNLIA